MFLSNTTNIIYLAATYNTVFGGKNAYYRVYNTAFNIPDVV